MYFIKKNLRISINHTNHKSAQTNYIYLVKKYNRFKFMRFKQIGFIGEKYI